MTALGFTLRLCTFGLLTSGLCGCFLVGLSDGLGQKSCESDADCAQLDPEDGDVCMAWQCQADNARGGSNYCQYSRLDADHDGVLAAVATGQDGGEVSCVAEDEPADCDDDNPRRAPDLAEDCDGVDNDCDMSIDEGVLTLTPNTAVLFDEEVTQADFAINAEAGTLAAVYASAAGGLPGASLVALDTTEAASEKLIPLSVDGVAMPTAVTRRVAVATLDSASFALAYFDDSGSERLVAGLLPRSSGNTTTITMDPDVYRWGLACEAQEACAANADKPDTTVRHPNTQQLALATSGRRVLLAYQRTVGGATPACGAAPEPGEEPAVMINMLSKPATENVLVDVADEALVLGRAREVDQPAVVTLPELDGVGGFLVAFTEQSGEIAVYHIVSTVDGATATRTSIVIEADNATPVGRPAIAVDEGRDGTAMLTLAYRVGCDIDSAIAARMFTLRSDGEALMARELAGPLSLSDENAANRPAVAYSASTGLWGVTYRSPAGLHVRLLEGDGKVRGEASYLLIDGTPDEGDDISFLHNPSIFPLDATNDVFGAAGLAKGKTSDRHTVELGRLDTCEP